MIPQSYFQPANLAKSIASPINSYIDIIEHEQTINKNLLAVSNSEKIVSKMSLKEKIGQKIMLDFRYWREPGQTNDKLDMVQLTETIKKIIKENHIGGVILFANNLKDVEQIRKLAEDLGKIFPANGIPLFIATDSEGGSVFRLPRGEFSSFAGNMALGAAVEGTGEMNLAYKQASVMGRDLSSLGINTNFAPVMDVNSNQDNPVINVRSFGDNPTNVSLLARQTIAGFGSKNIVSVAKHFPGHGDTVTDSHVGLPVVNKSRRDAYTIDLAPYCDAILSGESPDMIMTAHIQYPALDDTKVKNKRGEDIILPATLSKKIQTDLLRNKLGFKGVTITDALDMKAISDNFDIDTVMERVFQAGVDIALMPVRIYSAEDVHKLEILINNLSRKITASILDEHDISISVSRIIDLKSARGILSRFPMIGHYDKTLSKILEKHIAETSITLLKNVKGLIPLNNKNRSIYILMPWSEQSAAIRHTLVENGYRRVKDGNLSETGWRQQQTEIYRCAVFITGNMSDRANAVGSNDVSLHPDNPRLFEKSAVHRALLFAKRENKKVVYLSLKAPYDVIDYDRQADAVLATYSFYGSDGHNRRGLSLNAAAEIIIGRLPPRGKLPVNIYEVDNCGNSIKLRYPRGFGLTGNHGRP